MPVASLRALLERVIDYAGLFPPATLDLAEALRNHAAYLRSPDRWMLGAFVLPVAEFDVAAAHLGQFDREHRLEVSALAPKPTDQEEFLAGLGSAAGAIGEFNRRFADVAVVKQIESTLPREAGGSLGKATALLAETEAQIFWEAPADDAAATISALAGTAAGFKLRTGGVTAAAFPAGAQIARALVAAAGSRVAIKFTAGLHHPVRLFHASVQTKMHGFLNVIGAGVLAAEHGWDEGQTEELLAEEDASAFRFDDEQFSWRDWKISTEQIRRQRRLITSLGSCSFDEPREDLRALGLL